jgi:hypothetical protein
MVRKMMATFPCLDIAACPIKVSPIGRTEWAPGFSVWRLENIDLIRLTHLINYRYPMLTRAGCVIREREAVRGGNGNYDDECNPQDCADNKCFPTVHVNPSRVTSESTGQAPKVSVA